MVPTVLGGIGGGADATSILTSSTSRPITVTFRAMVIRAMPGLWDPWFLVLRVPSVVPHEVFQIFFLVIHAVLLRNPHCLKPPLKLQVILVGDEVACVSRELQRHRF